MSREEGAWGWCKGEEKEGKGTTETGEEEMSKKTDDREGEKGAKDQD